MDKAVKLAFVGDLALGDHPKSVGFGFYSTYKTGIPDQKKYKITPNWISSPDIFFGNLEFELSNKSLKTRNVSSSYCRGLLDYIPFLKSAGFNVLNIANNHMYQHGDNSFQITREQLQSNGIKVCGLPSDFNKESFFKINNLTIAYLGWNCRPRQDFTDSPPYNEFDLDICLNHIRNVKKYADIICVSLHWGEEFIQIPSDYEKIVARKIIDSGANVVIGHHPHVLREIENYNGGLIAYSLGNFICDMTWSRKTTLTGHLLIEFSNSKIINWTFSPGTIGDDFFPKYFDRNQSKNVLNNLHDLYEKLGYLKEQSSYEELAHIDLRKHTIATTMHFLKNIFKYKPKFIYEILNHAILSRISGK